MLLGGSRFLMPVIKAAKDIGCYTITCDYLPNNYAHKYSDEYCNVSIVDKDAVLKVAEQLHIDGIMSFACDPGVITAAYVAEKLGLPTCGPYESVQILQDKGQFRSFLSQNHFTVPVAKSYSSIPQAIEEASLFNWPVIVKPVDSAGSKGVSRVDDLGDLEKSIKAALLFSHCKEFIIEDFIEKRGCSSDSDSFSVDGLLKFASFSSQRFDSKALNPYTPSAYSWPSTISDANQNELKSELQRLLSLLHMETSIYNIETRESTGGKAYIMEVSPRGGGNRLADMLKYSTGVDLITNAVKASIGEPLERLEQKPCQGCWAEVILHSDKSGVFQGLYFSSDLKEYVVEQDLWVKEGDAVGGFSGANQAIGTLIMNFKDNSMLNFVLENLEKYVKIGVR